MCHFHPAPLPTNSCFVIRGGKLSFLLGGGLQTGCVPKFRFCWLQNHSCWWEYSIVLLFQLNRRTLSRLNVAQLQLIQNDYLAQIETLNEELVGLLVTRDELGMEQDAMLTDIEDLSEFINIEKAWGRGDASDRSHTNQCYTNVSTWWAIFFQIKYLRVSDF